MKTVLGCVLVHVLLALPAVAQRFPDIKLNTASSTNSFPQVEAAGSAVYVMWSLGTRQNAFDVLFNRSIDRGASWLANQRGLAGLGPVRRAHHPFDTWGISNRGATAPFPFTIPVFPHVSWPHMAASGSSVYVVWQDSSTSVSEIHFNRSLNFGFQWEGKARLQAAPGSFFAGVSAPRVAASGDAVYAVWSDFRSGLALNGQVFFNRSMNHGETWLADDRRLDSGTGDAANVQIAASGNAVYVVWEDDRDGRSDVYFNRSLDNGTTWLPAEVRLDIGSPGEFFSWCPQVATSGASVYVTWRERAAMAPFYRIHVNRSLDRGTTWLPNAVSLGLASFETTPQVAASDAAVYVVWSNNGINFNRSLDRGSTWLPLPTIHGFFIASRPTIVASGGSIFLAWHDGRSGFRRDVYFKRSVDRGTTWLDEVRMDTGTDPGASNAAFPDLAVADSSAYVVWHDNRADREIYFNIPFGFVPYGAGKAGSAGIVPSLDATGPAQIGETPQLEVTGGLGGASGFLTVGGSKASVPILGGTLLVGVPRVAPGVLLGGAAGVPGVGTLSVPLPIPDDPIFLGVPLFFQVIALDGGASSGLSMTNGVELWIG